MDRSTRHPLRHRPQPDPDAFQGRLNRVVTPARRYAELRETPGFLPDGASLRHAHDIDGGHDLQPPPHLSRDDALDSRPRKRRRRAFRHPVGFGKQ